MIMTRMFINVRRRDARKLLASPRAMHAAVESAFPPGSAEERVLWRVDGLGTTETSLLIVSAERPDLHHLEEQAGWPSNPTFRSTSYDGLLDSLAPEQTWAFRLTANPTHRAKHDGRTKVFAHVTAAQQSQWLLDRADRIGVALDSDTGPTFSVQGRDVKRFQREGHRVTLAIATFDGVLRVVDPVALRHALVSGVGRGKAYGCGLLTLARA